MDNIILLFACLAIGMILRYCNRVPENAHVSINAFIIHVSLPAVILLQVHTVRLDAELFYAALMPWLIFVVSVALFWVVGAVFKLPPRTTGARCGPGPT